MLESVCQRPSTRRRLVGIAMPELHLQLLGDFRLDYDGGPFTGVNSPRLQSLLAYLVLHAQAPQSRQHLAFLLWPESTEAQARTNLRQLLYNLRRTLPEPDIFLQIETQTLQWHPQAPFTLDVAQFEAALTRAEQAASQSARHRFLEEAVNLYTGNLLPSCYDDWILPERERLRQQFISALEQLIQLWEDQHEFNQAIYYAQRLLRDDPLHETTYRRLIRLHVLNNDRASALRVYHNCATILQRELGVEPSTATRAVYEQLLKIEQSGQAQASRPSTTLTIDSPLLGRSDEWERLQRVWRLAYRGQSHLVLVAGEAGIGKTKLLEKLVQWAALQDITTAKTRSYAAQGGLAYAPVAAWLRTDALRAGLSRLDDIWLTEVARLLPELLVERPDLSHPEPLTDSWQRQRFFEALARATLSDTDRRPLLLVLDDLQWCDQETLAWLNYLLHFNPHARLLVATTARLEEVDSAHPAHSLLLALRNEGKLTEVELEPLDETETGLLAAHVAGQELALEQAAKLYKETEGNPLFIVETIRAQLDREGQADVFAPPAPLADDASALPPRVQAVIEARLAQLSPLARNLAHLAATIGREFTFSVLANASDSDEDTLVRGLDELWQRRIVREQGEEAYDFSHDKLREAAYAEVSAARRRQLHRRVAQALETVHTADLDSVSAQLAAHYEQAGLPEQAIAHYRRAAEISQRVYANEETINLLNRALILLDTLPHTSHRDEQELALQTALGVPLVATKGYGATAVRETYIRALALCQQLEKPASPPILRALAISYVVQPDLRQAYQLGEQLLKLARRKQDEMLLVEGHYVLGVVSFWRGEFAASREHLETALAHYGSQRRRTHLTMYTQDPEVICLSRLAWTLWYLGYPDQAVRKAQEALSRAQSLAHPYSLAYAHYFAIRVYGDCRDDEAMLAQIKATIDYSTKHEFFLWLWLATLLEGWILARKGNIKVGIEQMQRAIAKVREAGQNLTLPYNLALIARAYALTGEVEQGLSLMDEALTATEHSGEHWSEVELIRLKGELLLLHGEAVDEVAAHFRQAMDLARRQGAKSLELRAVTSLGRLWRSLGSTAQKQEAQQMLQAAYDEFSEGFNTPDLQEARLLLQEMSAHSTA
jgi:DNA-binding SARP family transcriptional activator/predicted ATPase